MKLDTRFALPVAILTVTLVSGPVAAQEQEQAPDEVQVQQSQPQASEAQASEAQASQEAEAMTAQGELLRVDAETKMFWIETADGKEQQFTYNDNTEVTGEAENVEGLSTHAGTRVNVEYRAEGEAAVATKIAIQPEAAEEAAPVSPAPQQ
jgi:hypothetical protein